MADYTTYASPEAIKAGAIVRVSPPVQGEEDRGWCIVASAEGTDVYTPYPPKSKFAPQPGDYYVEYPNGSVTIMTKSQVHLRFGVRHRGF